MFGSTDAVFFPTFLLYLRLVLCRPEGTFFMAQRKYPGNNRYHTLFIESLPAIMAIETLGGVQPLQKRAREHRHRHHGGMPPRYLRKLAVMLSPLGWRNVHTAICRRPQNPVRALHPTICSRPQCLVRAHRTPQFAAVPPLVLTDAFHASDLLPPKTRIHFGAILALVPLQAQGEFYSDYSHPIMRFLFERISTHSQPMTGLTEFTRFRSGQNLATDGTDSAVRKIPLKSPNMPPDQAFLKGPLIIPKTESPNKPQPERICKSDYEKSAV